MPECPTTYIPIYTSHCFGFVYMQVPRRGWIRAYRGVAGEFAQSLTMAETGLMGRICRGSVECL